METEWIDKKIKKLKKDHMTSDPILICKDLGIEINQANPDYYLLCGLKSIYFRDFYGKPTIFIRNDLSEYEEQFILKHELGHVILHPELSCSAHTNTGKIDKQANYFALALSGIKLDFIDIEGMTLQQVASYSNIPYEPLCQLVN